MKNAEILEDLRHNFFIDLYIKDDVKLGLNGYGKFEIRAKDFKKHLITFDNANDAINYLNDITGGKNE